MKPVLEVYRSKNHKFYVRLRAANGETMNGTQGYVTKSNAKRAAKALPAIVAAAAIVVLGGCASAMYQGMTAEQINAAAKDNKAVYQCADIPSIGGGTAKMRSMIVDTGVVRYGNFSAKTCDDITFTNENKAPGTPSNPASR